MAEIFIIDGGSDDETWKLAQTYAKRSPAIHVIDASPIPDGWNGKAWGLHCGLQQVSRDVVWILTLDADVRPAPLLVSSLLAHAETQSLAVLSVATLQEIASPGEGFLHPSLLTTLVYRFGSPGGATHDIHAVQANGQCFLVQRRALEACGGFAQARDSLCEDITTARALAAAGYQVGFYEAGPLIRVHMYANGRETWENWTRSLPMHDRFAGSRTLIGWLEVLLIQALPLPLLLWQFSKRQRSSWLLLINSIYVLLRLGILFGVARAYQQRPWSYWLSPLCDLPVAGKLAISATRRRHSWRGRTIIARRGMR